MTDNKEVLHLVGLKFKADVSEAAIAELTADIKAMVGVVPGLISVTMSTSVTARDKGHKHLIAARFADEATIPVYRDHPTHQAVVSKLKPLLDEGGLIGWDIAADGV